MMVRCVSRVTGAIGVPAVMASLPHQRLQRRARRPAQGQLDPVGLAVAVHGKARRVRPAVAHGGEHAGHQAAELRLQRLVLEKQTDDAAHEGEACRSRESRDARTQLYAVSTDKHYCFFIGNTLRVGSDLPEVGRSLRSHAIRRGARDLTSMLDPLRDETTMPRSKTSRTRPTAAPADDDLPPARPPPAVRRAAWRPTSAPRCAACASRST